MEEDLAKLFEDKIKDADNLIDSLRKLIHVKGISKLRKLIIAERNFLVKTASKETKHSKYLSTTNLTHFEALISTAMGIENCDAILQPFSFKVAGSSKRIVVDIVGAEGREWIKVTARNPKGLMMSYLGDATFGSRTIYDQACDFIECASQNPIYYVPPKIIFKFCSGIDPMLAMKISNVGVDVIGEVLPSSCYSPCDSSEDESVHDEKGEISQSNDENSSSHFRKPILKLNLDITALIAYVSDMTNGGVCEFFLQEPLTLQAQSEKKVKVKNILDNLFDGKELYCCETAMDRFKEILEVVGGKNEKERAKLFLERVTVVPDCVSERVQNLKKGGQIKDRPRTIFGTGDSMKAVTVSANWGFCRSAQHQGVTLATFLHEPRALSEQASIVSQHHQPSS